MELFKIKCCFSPVKMSLLKVHDIMYAVCNIRYWLILFGICEKSYIWEVSPRAGIDCYRIGDFLVCSEAYKLVDSF